MRARLKNPKPRSLFPSGEEEPPPAKPEEPYRLHEFDTEGIPFTGGLLESDLGPEERAGFSGPPVRYETEEAKAARETRDYQAAARDPLADDSEEAKEYAWEDTGNDKPSTLRGWNPYTDGITQTVLSRFLSCPEKHRLAMVEMLSPVKATEALAFGDAGHRALEAFYGVMRDETLRKSKDAVSRGSQLIREVLYRLQGEDARRMKDRMAITEDIQAVHKMYAILEVVLVNYVKYWHEDFRRMNWVSLEEKFEVPFSGGKGRPFIEPLMRRGKFDGIFRETDNGLNLFETKFKGRIEEDSVTSKLSFDLQVFFYLSAVREIYKEEPAGVLYNIVRRPQLRQRVNETLEEFIQRIRVDIEERPEWYFMRYSVTIMPGEIDKWLTELEGMIAQLMLNYHGSFHYRNSAACSMGGYNCEFLPVCGRNDRFGYYRREHVFPELVEIEVTK